MPRVRWLFVALAFVLALGLAAPSNCLAAGPRHVVLFVADDLGPDAGCYGNPVVKTPRLDALAAEGLLFTHAFCTTASCSASRSVILSGLHNHATAQFGHEHDYHHFRTYEHLQTLPKRLKDAGYRTARVGKFHVGPESVYPFDHVLPGNARQPTQMADNCAAFVSAGGERPFFLYFCTADPHRGAPVAGDPRKINAFGNNTKGLPADEETTYRPEDVIVPPFLPDTPTCRAELAQYYQSVSRVDRGLGRLIDVLKRAGVYDDTLLIVTSDHGVAFPGAKTNLYDPGMRVPLVVRPPGGQWRGQSVAGGERQAMVSLCDVTPTILDHAGVDVAAAKLQGRSFLPVLAGDVAEGWNEVCGSHTFHEITMYYPMRVVRGRKHKLIWNIAHPLPFPFASDLWEAPTWQEVYKQGPDALYGQRSARAYLRRPRFELYDLESDPHEVRNLAEKPEHAALLAELQEKLRAFQKRTSDPWLLKWEYE